MTFKETFKYYKSKNPPPDLKNVIDFDTLNNTNGNISRIPIKFIQNKPFFGLKPPHTWQVYEFIDKPGLIFIKNPFTSLGQRYWTVRCLKDYTKKPNKSNMDPLNLVPQNKQFWEMCQSNNVLLMNKLRWMTLGYHHNWDTKVYSEDNRGKLPQDLWTLTRFIAETLGYENYSAEAAIVNYYHMDSTLSGHTDHSEKNLEAPLFSFSFGQTAVFLIGGPNVENPAIPLFLRSGDVIVMGKQSRLCYHGVPKILLVDSKLWNSIEDNENEIVPSELKSTVRISRDDELWKPFGDYLSHSRININVRQVLYDGEAGLELEDYGIDRR